MMTYHPRTTTHEISEKRKSQSLVLCLKFARLGQKSLGENFTTKHAKGTKFGKNCSSLLILRDLRALGGEEFYAAVPGLRGKARRLYG